MPATPRSILRKRDNASNDRKHRSQDEAARARVYQAIRAEAIQRRAARRTVGPSSEGAGPSHERSGSGLRRVRFQESRSERREVRIRGKVFEDLGGGILVNHGLVDRHATSSDGPSVPTAPSTPVPTRPNSPDSQPSVAKLRRAAIEFTGQPTTPVVTRPSSPIPAASNSQAFSASTRGPKRRGIAFSRRRICGGQD
ncbi:hypothetical protein B0H21DRAFT_586298 [Amylocystis lapponica]|nr:hypothetical protein B0H21DRAFT_586298 [Amylocystis lapponica]